MSTVYQKVRHEVANINASRKLSQAMGYVDYTMQRPQGICLKQCRNVPLWRNQSTTTG